MSTTALLWYRLRRPWILMLIGAGLGIASYAATFPAEEGAGCIKELAPGFLITELVPQPTQRYYQPTKLDIKASRPMFTELKPEHTNTYYMACGKNCHPPQRAFRQLGFQKVNDQSLGRLQHMDWGRPTGLTGTQSWQRFNHIPNTTAFTKKDSFLTGMAAYHERQAKQLYFMPKVYRLHVPKERASLERLIKRDESRPWILRKGLTKDGTLSILPPGASTNKELTKVVGTSKAAQVAKDQSLVTEYVCNQLQWEGQLFSVRVFWFVASMDPLLVFYQDGYVRIGYNQTIPYDLKAGNQQATDFDSLEEYLRDYAKFNKRKLRKTLNIDQDPVIHVRNQFKESIATVVDAFHDQTFSMPPRKKGANKTAEDGYEVFAADFIIDQHLDVYLTDVFSDSSPHPGEHNAFLLEDNYFLLAKNHELWYGMGLTLLEVWAKQARSQNILPLKTTGKWDLIVASNVAAASNKKSKGLDWMFAYKGYERDSKKVKKCNLWKNKQQRQRLPRMPGDEQSEES